MTTKAELRRPDLPSTQTPVVIPHLTELTRDFNRAGSFLSFEGRTWPDGFRGETKELARNLSAVFNHSERALATALVDALEAALDRADARLQLTTETAAEVIDEMVQVHAFTVVPGGGGITRIDFRVMRVN